MIDHDLPRYPVNVAKLPGSGMRIRLEASPEEFRQIAAYLNVLELVEFSGLLNFIPWGRDGLKVEGEIKASLNSACPVTLNPVRQDIVSNFSAKFVPDGSKLAKPRLNNEGEMVLDVDSDDIPDVFEGDELDAWAIALEYLLLEIDHFARAEGAQLDEITSKPEVESAEPSPFAKLQSLKK